MDRYTPPGLANSLDVGGMPMNNRANLCNLLLSPPFPNLALDDMMTLANSHPTLQKNIPFTNQNLNSNSSSNSGFKNLFTSSKVWICIGLLGFSLLLYVVYIKYVRAHSLKGNGATSSNMN